MRKIIFFTIAAAILLVPSCNEPSSENGLEKPNNYWQSNDLRKLQLKGKVKSLEYIDRWRSHVVYEFDKKGRISAFKEFSGSYALSVDDAHRSDARSQQSVFYPIIKKMRKAKASYPDNAATYTEIYKYDMAGRLAAIEDSDGGIITYRYGTHGAFVPLSTDPPTTDLKDLCLFYVKNLSVLYYDYEEETEGSARYFYYYKDSIGISGAQMKRHVTEFEADGRHTYIYYDTTHITLNSEKCPIYIDRENKHLEFSYYSNNLLKDAKDYGNTYSYKADDEYLLIEKITSIWEKPISYSYNENKDLILEDHSSYKIEYIYNEYDENGNWTKRTRVTTSNYSENEEEEETRTILYY